MNNLFALAPNETTAGSVFFLNSIFGTVGNVLGGAGPQLLGTMFQVFNTAVLALGSLMVTYTTVVSILLTAHEGEALGKKFHSLWIPMRTVMGIAALVPTSTGYSYLQIALMWLIIQGVGAADTLWATTINYVASGHSTVPAAPGRTAGTLKLQMGQLWQGLVCQAAAKANYVSGSDGGGYFCANNPTDGFCTATDTLSITPGSSQVKDGKYQMGPGSASCGALTLGDSSAKGQAQNQAFSQIIATLGSLASQLVALDYGYATYVNADPLITPPPTPPAWLQQYCTDNNLSGSQCIPSAFSAYPPPSAADESKSTVENIYWKYGLSAISGGNFIQTAGDLYTGIVGAAMTSGGGQESLASVQQTAINNGWIYAGGYFYYIAKANNSVASSVSAFDVAQPDFSNRFLPSTAKTMFSAAGTIATYVGRQLAASGSSGGTSVSCGGSLPSGGANSLCGDIINGWMESLSGGSGGQLSQNPVLAAQNEGHTIITAVEVVIPIIFFLNVGVGLAGGIYLGTGPFAMAALATVNSIIPLAMFIILIFLGLGLTLAVYTPMIPYILFTFGAINWLIATIETMIAGPLVAIGLLHPEGHEIWGQAEKAMMLVLNIFLRPSLMIFGMISGMLMTYTVVMMINYAFLNVVNMVSGNSANVIEMIFFMILYTSIFTTSMNKCFDLIHVVPDKILRWIGGGSESFGEGGSEKIGQAQEAGGGKAGEFAKGAGDKGAGAKKAGEAYHKGKEAKKKQTGTGAPPADASAAGNAGGNAGNAAAGGNAGNAAAGGGGGGEEGGGGGGGGGAEEKGDAGDAGDGGGGPDG